MVVAGTPYGAEALMGHLLRHTVGVATEREGAPDEVVLTHPATWGEFKLDLLREAGRVAGCPDVTLLTEPQAAALHYAQLGRIGVGDAVAVYDFGGGTFDIAIVRCTDAGAEIVGHPEGLERLGGIDLDQIEAVLSCVLAGNVEGDDSQLLAGGTDEPHWADADVCVDSSSVLSDNRLPVRMVGFRALFDSLPFYSTRESKDGSTGVRVLPW